MFIIFDGMTTFLRFQLDSKVADKILIDEKMSLQLL